MGQTELPARHRLLPHERWFASRVLERQQARRSAKAISLERNLGPEGIALYAAMVATAIPASLLMCAGIVLLFASDDRGLLFEVARWLTDGGVALWAAGMLRGLQARRVARAFQRSSPFDRT